jgi:Tfp pilus assembly protein PilN
MTVQFNLLPDIKVEYLKARRQQHLVVMVSTIASVVAVAIFALLITVVYGLQKKNINDLNTDIHTASTQLQGTQDLTKILTVQNQLKALPALHDKKVVASRMFDYLTQVTPANVSITKLDVDFSLNTMTVSGSGPDLTAVNTFTDSLKFTKYTTKTQTSQTNAFSSVVLSNFTRNSKNATYEITFKFDPVIFGETQEVQLTVPQIISTRSEVDKPADLFQQSGGQ